MHTGALKKWALALTFWLALHLAPLKAQLLGPRGTSPITFEVDANGLLSDTGTLGTGSLSLSGAGTRMFWYPGKAAFRAGNVSGTDWNDSNIGQGSVAFGQDTTALGRYSLAGGYGTTASGNYSIAWGGISTASGQTSFVFGGFSSASGSWSMAVGQNTSASGNYSVALGANTGAEGTASFAVGLFASATATFAVAEGAGVTASGYGSAAFNQDTTASGNRSATFNFYTTARAYESTAFGQYNLNKAEGGGTPNSTSWIGTAGSADPLFEIGNGTSTTPADALVVYKDGNTAVQGELSSHTGVRCNPGGDLSMGSFTAGTAP